MIFSGFSGISTYLIIFHRHSIVSGDFLMICCAFPGVCLKFCDLVDFSGGTLWYLQGHRFHV